MDTRRFCRWILFGAALGLQASAADVANALAEANALRDNQRHAEARAAYARILKETPDSPEANYAVGLYACDDGNWEKALACEAKAVAADPNNAKYQYGWGAANGVSAMKAGVFSKLGYAKKCLAGYRKAAELEPTNPRYHFALMSFYQQAPGFAGGDMTLAYAQASEIKKLDPALGRQAYAQLYLGEKKYDQAFHEYEEALQRSPDDYTALYGFGRLAAITSKRLEQGRAALRRCLALPTPKAAPSHANVHWQLGKLAAAAGQADEARREYEAALKEDPGFGPAKQALQKLAEAGTRAKG